MAALTGGGGQVFVHPPTPGQQFPEKATRASGDSPGILEGTPSLWRGGPGLGWGITIGLQGSNQTKMVGEISQWYGWWLSA